MLKDSVSQKTKELDKIISQHVDIWHDFFSCFCYGTPDWYEFSGDTIELCWEADTSERWEDRHPGTSITMPLVVLLMSKEEIEAIKEGDYAKWTKLGASIVEQDD